jgi:hypothetical protein
LIHNPNSVAAVALSKGVNMPDSYLVDETQISYDSKCKVLFKLSAAAFLNLSFISNSPLVVIFKPFYIYKLRIFSDLI